MRHARRRNNRPAAAAPPRAVLIDALEPRLLLARPLGIDISHWQPTAINWAQVKSGNGSTIPGRDFAYAKASEGLTYHDDHFVGYVTGAPAAAMKIGAYHYARH